MELGFLCCTAHFIGDYWLQNDWMAINKKKKWFPAIIHGIIYTLPFLFITKSIPALFIICSSHIIIDHTNLVSFLNKVKNWNFNNYSIGYFKQEPGGLLQKASLNLSDGYNLNRPLWLRVWLLIIQDNILHIIINYLSIKYL